MAQKLVAKRKTTTAKVKPRAKAALGKATGRRPAVKAAAKRSPAKSRGRIKTIAVSKRELAKSVKPEFFKLRAQLLSSGNTEDPLAVGENLWVKIKVYAEGGENELHMHPYQDHSFIVLDGKASFHGPRGEQRTLKRSEGIFLPAGSYYWFEQVGKAPLVLLRVGATNPAGHPDTRVMPDGEWKVRRGRAEVYRSKDAAYRKGVFYGD